MYKYLWFCLVLLFACNDANQSTSNPNTLGAALFKSIPSSHSGINFKNQLTENLSTGENILDFDFFFNGSGLAIGDFDNDGLEDIFFAANQVENRIYKNEGGLKFSDKTAQSGINKVGKGWSNGVSCADINGDGLLDIYISQGGPYGPEKRENLLLVNEGNFTFSEQAAKYGLNDIGISTQASFFDFDKDGDLDCFVMNESPLIGFDPVKFYSMINRHSSTLLNVSCSHLYENDNGRFVDISQESGVLQPSFGLGLCISDINGDNWLDIYVANDYYIPDAVYLNDQKGGFTNATKDVMNQSSFYSMGIDIADIDNDGHQDIYVLDMATSDHIKSKTLMASMNVKNFELLTKDLGFPYQYMFNALQLNNGKNKFNNVSHISGTAKTDWSWAGLIEDFDQDGTKEIFVSNGYRKYARDNDFQGRVTALKQKFGELEIPLEEKEALYKTVPSEKLPNVFFKQKSALQFENIAEQAGLETPSFSNGAAYADLDNDGDLDLVINNIDQEAFLYENTSTNNNYLKIKLKAKISESFAKVNIYYDSKQQICESKRVRGYLSSQPNDIYFGLGKVNTVDSLIVYWPDGKTQKIINVKSNQTITLDEKQAVHISTENKNNAVTFMESKTILSNFKHRENSFNDFLTETLVPYKQSVHGPEIKKTRAGIFISGSKSSPAFLLSEEGEKMAEFQIAGTEISNAIFFDLEQDGDQDVYLIAGGNEAEASSYAYDDQLFINQNGKYTKANNQGRLNTGASGKTGIALDFDKDGDEDLIVCNRIVPKQYPVHAPSIVLENEDGILKDNTKFIAPDLSEFGIINDIQSLDFNQDGWMDFMVVGEWTGIGLFQNKEGKFENVSSSFGLNDKLGWWFSITPTDINRDGKLDYVIGNLGLNSKYKVSSEKPLRIYGNDFDQNGSYDQVLSYTYKGKEVPFRGRQCSSEQMPFIAEKFKTYDAFANASMKDVYGTGLQSAIQKTVNKFASIILINNGTGFDIETLPIKAQLRPVLDGLSVDINKDGYLDLILIGNLYETEVETPRLDFSNATVLLSNGKEYKFSQELTSQLIINGNSKSIELIKDPTKQDKVLIGVNNLGLKEFIVN